MHKALGPKTERLKASKAFLVAKAHPGRLPRQSAAIHSGGPGAHLRSDSAAGTKETQAETTVTFVPRHLFYNIVELLS